MLEIKEKKEKYVTEDMLERAFVKFGQSFGKSLRKEIAEDTKKIVDSSIAVAIEASENRLGLIMLKHFDRLDKKIDDGLDAVTVRLDGIDVRLDGIDIRLNGIDGRLDRMEMRFDRLEQRFDNHLLDCITIGEHKNLEKRVSSIEILKGKFA